jgi:uracil-DNA glycosylase family 4
VSAVDAERELRAARVDAAGCRRCDLYRSATQTAFGEDAAAAELMLVGEQPGDEEDEEGRPFVGPARRRRELRRELAADLRLARDALRR